MALQDTDNLIVGRGNQTFKIAYSDLKDDLGTGGGGGGGDVINPDPITDTITSPGFEGGNGSEASPFVITAADSFLNGTVYSDQTITFYNQTPGSSVRFSEVSGNVDNGLRFTQPVGTVDANGQYSFKLKFDDNPQTVNAPNSYTGVIKCGDTHFTWTVTVITVGIEKPEIVKIQGSDGTNYDAPTAPLYETVAGPVASLTADVTGLTASATSGTLTASGGIGTGLTATFATDADGNIISITIVDAGDGYVYGDLVEFDLSSIGGSATQELKVFVEPVTGPVAAFQVSAFNGTNAGSFKEMQWEISTDPTFPANNKTEVTVSANSTNVTVATGIPLFTEYYARFRYRSGSDVYSSYSSPVRAATSSAIALQYILKNYDLQGGPEINPISPNTKYMSFNSGEFYVAPMEGTQVVCVVDGGTPGGKGGTRQFTGGNEVGYPGERPQAGVYVQLRQQIQLKITEIFPATGAVVQAEENNIAFGMNDFYKSSHVDATSTPQGNNICPMDGGSGTGFAPRFYQRASDGRTMFRDFANENAGVNYQVGDIVTFDFPPGNGCYSHTSDQQGDNLTPTPEGTPNYTGINRLTLDSYWDYLIHGIGGTGGRGGKNRDNNSLGGAGGPPGSYFGNGTNGSSGTGGVAGGAGGVIAPVGTLYAAVGANGQGAPGQGPHTFGSGGGGAGAGWAGGTGGGAGYWNGQENNNEYTTGGGGGGGSLFDKSVAPAHTLSTTSYAERGIDLLVNGTVVGTATPTHKLSHKLL
jgi:hypothetical protein